MLPFFMRYAIRISMFLFLFGSSVLSNSLCILLFFATAIPLVYAVDLTAQTIRTEKKTLLSAVVAIGAFVFVLFNNKYYNEFYAVVSGKLYPVFWVFGLFLPVLVFCLRGKNRA